MRKVMAMALAVTAAALLLTGCFSMLPDGFDDQVIAEKAQTAVELFNEKRFDEITEMFQAEKQEELSDELWKEKFGELIDQYGAFEGYDNENSQMVGHQDESTGTDYAVVQIMVNYANGQLVHNMIFDIDGKLVSYQIGVVEEE